MSEKTRVQNFTTSEKLHLLRIISHKYASIIEDKRTNRASAEKKEKTWHQITDDFNATSSTGILRSMASLKKCYENRKKELRKTLANEEREVRLNGGGALPKIKRDDIDELLMSIINHKFDEDGDESIIVYRDADGENEVELLEYIVDDEDSSENTHPARETLLVPDHSKPTSSRSRRRPIPVVETSSDITEKYHLLLNKRLMLVEKQLNHMEQENALIIKKRKLEIEILETELFLKQKNLD